MLVLCKETRARAELRRGLGLPVERCNYMHRYIVPWLRDHDDQDYADLRRAYYAVAALIASRPRTAREAASDETPPVSWYERPNLGASLGQGVVKDALKGNSAENVLHLMARQGSDAVHRGLPALVQQLHNGGIAVDWAVLLEDMAWWNRHRDRIATRWLDSYFHTSTGETGSATPDSAEENDR
ncbi:type I-E CRISPR-associated protein Cse2/CasB [Streptomyces sp. NPDC032161]|uniref:type I-E CRISPR-associated protein Cse2/CasB n=1 Tax=unclassified Streptomyces TaxID=2593676 RepID=UPI0033D90508